MMKLEKQLQTASNRFPHARVPKGTGLAGKDIITCLPQGRPLVEPGMETHGSKGLRPTVRFVRGICFFSWVVYFLPKALDAVHNCIELLLLLF